MNLLLLASLFACVPKNAGAVTPAVEVAGVERVAYEELSVALRERAAEGNRYELGAVLAEQLADGWADPDVRASAVVLLDELRREAGAAAVAVEPPVADAGDEPVDVVEVVVQPPEPVEPAVDPEGVARDNRAVSAIAGDKIERARTALRAADYALAIAELTPLKAGPAWSDARPFWEEAVDGYVGVERERVGELFLATRTLSGEVRSQKLEEVRDLLANLIDSYPSSSYIEPLTRNLERVERELGAAD